MLNVFPQKWFWTIFFVHKDLFMLLLPATCHRFIELVEGEFFFAMNVCNICQRMHNTFLCSFYLNGKKKIYESGIKREFIHFILFLICLDLYVYMKFSTHIDIEQIDVCTDVQYLNIIRNFSNLFSIFWAFMIRSLHNIARNF